MAYDLAHKPSDRRCVTAVFETEAAARTARDDLMALGFPADDIEIKSAAAHAVAPDQPTQDPGILRSLLGIFVIMPAADRMTFEEALRRGGVALAVIAGPQHYELAIDTLDRDGAINLEERAIAWTEDRSTAGHPAERAPPAASAEQAHDPLENPSANPDMREADRRRHVGHDRRHRHRSPECSLLAQRYKPRPVARARLSDRDDTAAGRPRSADLIHGGRRVG